MLASPHMPLPGWLRGFNRSVTNRVTGSFAGKLPGFAILTHTGRRSGRAYRTPVNLFRARDGYVIALTYGHDGDWVKNVMAARGCTARTRGRTVALERPRIVTDRTRALVPAVVRPILAATGVTEFMELTRVR